MSCLEGKRTSVIKLFASDLDGTLLNLVHDVDRTILSSVDEVCRQGCHFVVATGRCMRSNACFGFDGIPIDIACANGSIVYDGQGNLVDHRLLDKAFLEELLATFPGLPFSLMATDHTYVTASEAIFESGNTPPNPFMRVAMRGMHKSRAMNAPDEFVYDTSAKTALEQEVCKANVRVPDQAENRRLVDFLAAHDDVVTDAPFRPTMFEITNVDVNKGVAIAWLAHHLGISDDEVAVYGDGGNDVAMLERFDHAYVTSCATDDARAATDDAVIGSNVFHAVPRHMLRTLERDSRPQA